MTNLEFLKEGNYRTTLIPYANCSSIDYIINLMIEKPDWTYLQARLLQEELGLETYFALFPEGKFTEDRVDEIWKERNKARNIKMADIGDLR